MYVRLALASLILVLLGTSARAAAPWSLSSADSMQKVFRDEPWKGPPATQLLIEAAQNEVEGLQLLIIASVDAALKIAQVNATDLTADGGGRIPAAAVTWQLVDYVETEKPAYPTPKVGWWPDPLLPPRPFDVPAGRVQPVWLNVRVPAGTAPGTYRGQVQVRPVEGQLQTVPLEVRVWNFAVPKQQHLETSFPLRPDELQRFYRLKQVPLELYERWVDFSLDYRISSNLCDWPNFSTDMERLVARQLDRGGSAFCLGYAWFTQGPPEQRQKHNAEQVAQLKKLYERAKQRGWLDRAYVYCHDEIGKEHFPYAKELYGELKKAMPDLRLMQTFYKDEPVAALEDVLDIWAPNTGRYRPAEFQAQQAKGHGVWWYVCCGPGKPYANLMIEWPGSDHRLLLWQNDKFRVTGFLYWGLNVYRDNSAGEARWPAVPWKPATWRNDAGNPHHGDGQLIYPGPDGVPYSSVRLENLRDGIEDYEYLWLLRSHVARLKKAAVPAHAALLAEAKQALVLDDALVKDLTHFTDNPQLVRQKRAEVARLIERLQTVMP